MNSQSSIPSETISNKPKISKYIFIFLGLTALILIGEGAYYLYLKGFKISDLGKEKGVSQISQELNEEPTPCPDKDEKKFFEGPKLYAGEGEDKRLIAIEGWVEKINGRTITIVRKDGNDIAEDVTIEESLSIFFIEKGEIGTTEIPFSDLSVGDLVTYNPPGEWGKGGLFIHK